jgi:ribonuclease D
MYDYTLIDSDTKLDAMLIFWKEHHINIVAMDFEGEFNLHVYGEHLCLVQLFDGVHYFLVDPFAVSKDSLRSLLESPDLEKIMFDCASDASLVRKEFGIMLKRVYDVRLTAQILGIEGNLSALTARCLKTPPSTGKKSNQMANWLTRPLRTKLIEYALSDVEHLFAIRGILDKEAMEKGLGEKVVEVQKRAAIPNGPDKSGWEKLNGYRYLSKNERIYVKWFFEARDMLARKLNVPSVRVLEKKYLVEMAKNVPSDEKAFRAIARNSSQPVENDLVALLMVAKEGARKEIEDSLVRVH